MGIKEINKITYDDMKPIGLSFKKNHDDMELYKWILNHSGYSSFIKDVLRKAKVAEGGNLKDKNTNTKPNVTASLIDF